MALTEDAALRLEPVLGASAGFWLTREARYRERAAWLKAVCFYVVRPTERRPRSSSCLPPS